jgi:nucleoside phosphorylase
MTIGIQICSGAEWRAAKPLLGASAADVGRFPYGEYLASTVGRRRCVFYHSRRTKTRAAAACQYAIDHWHVDPVIVLGTCGGVAEHLRVMDIVVASRTLQYDCHDRRPDMGRIVSVGTEWLTSNAIVPEAHFGTIASADHDLGFGDLGRLREEGVLGADWESGAIALVCSLNQVKWAVVRGVSDVPLEAGVDDARRQLGDYLANTPAIMERLLSLLPALVRDLPEH